MCLITISLGTESLTDDEFQAAHDSNPDGLGVMWVADNVVHIRKEGPQTATAALAFYRMMNAHIQTGTAVWHWRFATHGVKSKEMSHPFRVRADFGVVHNGVIHGYGNKLQSDTADFVARNLHGRHDNAIDWKRITKATQGSRMAYLYANADGTASIHTTGSWDKHVQDNGTVIKCSNLHWTWHTVTLTTDKAEVGSYEWFSQIRDFDGTEAPDLCEVLDLYEDLARFTRPESAEQIAELMDEVSGAFPQHQRATVRTLLRRYATFN